MNRTRTATAGLVAGLVAAGVSIAAAPSAGRPPLPTVQPSSSTSNRCFLLETYPRGALYGCQDGTTAFQPAKPARR